LSLVPLVIWPVLGNVLMVDGLAHQVAEDEEDDDEGE
jgi:hypothetical protein